MMFKRIVESSELGLYPSISGDLHLDRLADRHSNRLSQVFCGVRAIWKVKHQCAYVIVELIIPLRNFYHRWLLHCKGYLMSSMQLVISIT